MSRPRAKNLTDNDILQSLNDSEYESRSNRGEKCKTIAVDVTVSDVARQRESMIKFLEGYLALGRVRSKEFLLDSLFAEFTEFINVEGLARTRKEWTKLCQQQPQLNEMEGGK